MSFEVFKEIVISIIREEFGIDTKIKFDTDDGKYIARVRHPEQPTMRVVGNSFSLGLTIRWGSGHQAMVPAERVAMMLSVA